MGSTAQTFTQIFETNIILNLNVKDNPTKEHSVRLLRIIRSFLIV